MNKRIFLTALYIILWAIAALGMTILYYYLKDIGFIWDNPDDPKNRGEWNTRKMIFGVLGVSSFLLLIAKIALTWEAKPSDKKPETE